MKDEQFIETDIPGWEISKERVYLSLYPITPFVSTFLNDPVSDGFTKYYIYAATDEVQFVWIDNPQLATWGIDELTFKEQVYSNMSTLLDKSKIETLDVPGGGKLAFFNTPIGDLRSALLFSPNLKDTIAPVLGWPVYAVLPARDFCYMFSEADKDDSISRLGPGVIEEYTKSRYQITTEIIRISDDGIAAIAKYKV